MLGKIHISRNQKAIALYSGCLGAYLQDSRTWNLEEQACLQLEKGRRWLLQHNPLFQRYDVRQELQLYPLPEASLTESDTSIGPSSAQLPYRQTRPDLIMNPFDYPESTTTEDHRSFRLPVASMDSSEQMNGRKMGIARSDPTLELLIFPVLYPWGRGQWQKFPIQRRKPYKDTQLADAKIKQNSVISHFRDDYYWPVWVYMEIEARRIFQNDVRLMRRSQQQTIDQRYTASELLQQSQYGPWSIVNEKLTTSIPKFIRTGDTFFLNAESKARCMLQTFGIPTIFVTTTFSECWEQYQEILRSTGNSDTLPTNRPWDAVQYYYERWHWIKTAFLKVSSVSGYGQLNEIVERHEFQLRGAIHTHSLLWTESSVESLIQQNYIRADLPDQILEPELYELVLQHQIHRCDQQRCGRNPDDVGKCRKGFPADLSPTTHQIPGQIRYSYQRHAEADKYVVPYSPRLLFLWKAHCNVQYCTSGGLAKYITKYVTKPEPKSVISVRSENHTQQHLLCRRIGSMENMVLLLGFPIFQMSSGCLYLPTTIPSERSATVKPAWILEADPNTENPYYSDALDKYFARLKMTEFESLTYFQYHSQYKIERCHRNTKTASWKDLLGQFVYTRQKVFFQTSNLSLLLLFSNTIV